MGAFHVPTTESIRALAERAGMEYRREDADGATRRIETLADIYRELEDTTPEPDVTSGVDERFIESPAPPESDPHNAWLVRCRLDRPDATGPLDGLDVAIKDNTCVRGLELTCGSAAFAGSVPGDHAAVVDRLLAAGATVVGKTNMDELAFGPTSETSAFGPTENPRAAGHVAGGSSSGSAAAVAAGEVDLALGTDTGGSVRIPASYCGIVGHKPTAGLVPLDGVVPMAASLDHAGPLAPDVETAARGLTAMTDGTRDFAADLGADPEALTVGVVPELLETPVSDAVAGTVREAIGGLASAGAETVEASIPELECSQPAWWGIAPPEFAATIATDGAGLFRAPGPGPDVAAAIRRSRRAAGGEFGANVKEMLGLGLHLLATHGGRHYVRAQRLREALTRGVDRALEAVDALATPATPEPALEIGGFERGVTPPVNWCTHPTDLTGHPSVSVPAGTVDGRPIGLQLIGPHGADQRVLDTAAAVERHVGAGSLPG